MLRWRERRLRMAWAVATIVLIGSSPLAAFGEELTDPVTDTTVTDPASDTTVTDPVTETTLDPVVEATLDPVDPVVDSVSDGTGEVSDTTSDATTTVEGDTSDASTDLATDDGTVLTDPVPSPEPTEETVVSTTETSDVVGPAPTDTTTESYVDTTTGDAAVAPTTTASSAVFIVEGGTITAAVSSEELPLKLQEGSVGAPAVVESPQGDVAAMLADTQNAEANVRGSARGKAPVADTEAPGLCPGAGGLVCALAVGTHDPGSLTRSVTTILHQLAFTGADAIALVKLCLMLAAAGALALRVSKRAPAGSFAGVAMLRAVRGWIAS